MGSLDGLFIATQKEVDEVIGKEVYFGEVLGKHSEIYGTLEAKDLEVIDIDETAINKLVAALGAKTLSGYNPIDYYENVDEELSEEDND
jgi:hypothetical protein